MEEVEPLQYSAHALPSLREVTSSRHNSPSTSSVGGRLSSSEGAGEKGVTYPRLPPELLLVIFDFATLYEPLSSRYATLRYLCTTSHLFRDVAQPMLFEVVEVTSGYSWEKLVEVVRMRPVLGEWVRVLRVEEWSLSTRLALNELSSSPERHPPPPSFPSVARAVLPFSLFWHLATANSVSTSSSTSISPFPLLRYLVLCQKDKARRYSIRIPLVLPSLRGIAAPLDGSLCKVLGELRLPTPILYRTSWQHFVDFMPPWRSFPSSTLGSIKHLHLLPLTYTPPSHYLSELIFRLQSDPALRELEALYLPTQWQGIGSEEDKDRWERVKVERGVEVSYEDAKDLMTGRGAGLLEGFVRRCEERGEE